MLISIIVPVYNIEKYLRRCADSILAQSFGDYEVILVDDGSTDSSPAICDSLASSDSRFRVLHRANGGPWLARYAGLNASAGEYVMFVDGDDWLNEGCLESVAGVLASGPPDLICFGSRYVYPGRTEEQIYPYTGLYYREQIEKEIFPVLIEDSYGRHFHTSIWGKVFKRDMLARAYAFGHESIRMGEDGIVVRPYVYGCSSIYFLREALYSYNRTNLSSATISLKPISWDNTLLIRQGLLEAFPHTDGWLLQINRNTCHNAFITSVSRFNSGAPYRETYREIKRRLSDGDISSASRRSGYRSLSGRLVAFLIRHRFSFAFYLYSRFPRHSV